MMTEKKDNTIDFVEAQIIRNVQRMRPPVEVRDRVDIVYTYEKQELILIEVRPRWEYVMGKIDHLPGKVETPFAKAHYVQSQHVWNLYWMRESGKWEQYQPHPQANSIDEFFQIVDEDAYGCFKG